jgi:hypothetical protein
MVDGDSRRKRMAIGDWDISGDGGQSVFDEGGSMRCKLTGVKLMLWNGRDDLGDSEVVADIKMSSTNTNCRGGLILRSNASGLTAYKMENYGNRDYYIRKVVNGVVTTLGIANSDQAYNIFVKTRFRIDGYQLSIEEWIDGDWELLSVVEDTSQAIDQGYAGLFGSSVNTGYFITFDNVEISEKQV